MEKRLSAIATVIEATLKAKYTKGVEPQGEWVRGVWIEDGITEEVRLLRHLYSMTNDNPPF